MSGRKRAPFGPIHSSSRPTTAPTPSSSTICSLPGFSTLSRERTTRQTARSARDDQQHHHEVVRDDFVPGEVKAERFAERAAPAGRGSR